MLGYSSWTACVKGIADEYGLSGRYLERLHSANQIESDIADQLVGEQTFDIPESQLRSLSNLEPEERKEVWQKAIATAPNGKVTAKHVDAA